ncbi:hypothetical protein QMK33_16025 [Hymenobacter sp. H14-R3]|uniref:hypothetical protein n=1 Tax=Hymenobacter sp. H14-R3 TaxID=3046308 RepID=UPI0024BBC57C|nr:hypothetical protein [Hymenobacter sp. H14-R3]MDJ0366666.1 hypothetical protein [Hymenobacter sp. H14-R3]
MTEDEQSGTLAFLQNFYTGVTLYMPQEAGEPAVAEAAEVAALPTVAAALPAPAAAIAAPVTAALLPATPPPVIPSLPSLPALSGKLPSLATVPASPVVAPMAKPEPVAPPVMAAPMPQLAAPTAPAAIKGPGPATDPPVAPYLLTTFATLGSNARGVVLLVRLSPEQFQKLPRNVFLNKLLQAIQLVMADVVLVNVEGNYPVALQNLRKEIAATHILAFGKNLLDVAVRTTQIYEPVQFPAVGLSYLAGAEVAMIEYDVSLKKRLWVGLQRMFLG